jgi:hypothetical protein
VNKTDQLYLVEKTVGFTKYVGFLKGEAQSQMSKQVTFNLRPKRRIRVSWMKEHGNMFRQRKERV